MPRPNAFASIFLVLAAACSSASGGATTTTSAATSTQVTTTTSEARRETPTVDPFIATPPVRTTEPATVRKVIDGDSFEAELGGLVAEIRLSGINAPEFQACWHDEAEAALAALIDGRPVAVDVVESDRFGRLVANVYGDDGLVNALLLEGGHAIAIARDHPFLAEFLKIEEEAFSAGRGLWAEGACGPATVAMVAVADVRFDAAGPDDENPNDEWAELVAETRTDLEGWTLRDESSTHRLVFPADAVIEPGRRLRVYSGCGENTADDIFWCADGAVWSNSGDTALLLDPLGNVVDRYRFGA